MHYVADVATIKTIAAHEAEQVMTRMDDLERRLEKRMEDLASSLRLATVTVLKMIEDLPAAATRPPVQDRRPKAIDAACAADPDAGRQRVEVKVFGRVVTEMVTPGSDPAAVWADLCIAVAKRAERSEAEAWPT